MEQTTTNVESFKARMDELLEFSDPQEFEEMDKELIKKAKGLFVSSYRHWDANVYAYPNYDGTIHAEIDILNCCISIDLKRADNDVIGDVMVHDKSKDYLGDDAAFFYKYLVLSSLDGWAWLNGFIDALKFKG